MAADTDTYPNPKYTVGLNNVGSYQVSGHPFMTGSLLASGEQMCIEFPFVAREITTIASGSNASMRVHFNPTGSGNVIEGKHYITLNSSEDALTISVRCKEIFVSAVNGGTDKGFEIFASLTNIPTERMYALTGSGLTD